MIGSAQRRILFVGVVAVLLLVGTAVGWWLLDGRSQSIFVGIVWLATGFLVLAEAISCVCLNKNNE